MRWNIAFLRGYLRMESPVALRRFLVSGLMVLAVDAAQFGRASSASPTSRVSVSTNLPTYTLGETIIVTIRHDLAVPIYALTGQTYCTIVTIQRQVAAEWIAEGRCLAFGPPGWIEIPPNAPSAVDVRPRLPSDRALAPGRHRVVFAFRVGSSSGAVATVFSPEFLISGLGRIPPMGVGTPGTFGLRA